MMISTIGVRRTVINVALAMDWCVEVDSNRGQAVDAITRRCGLEPPQPWCACFVSWCGRAALGSLWPMPMVGGCATLGEIATQRGWLVAEPTFGAIFLLWSAELNRYRHTGFVTAWEADSDTHWTTIEGNASPDGSPEGTGVFRRARTFGPKDRFIHWWRKP
jgi:hypothetical protein